MTDPAARQRTMTVLSVVVTAVLVAAYLAFGQSPTAERVRGLLGQDGRLEPEVSAGTVGSYRFLETQPGSDDPVGFSPCRPIRYAVNPTGAPPTWRDDVRHSVRAVSRATGLRFESVGTTGDRDFVDRDGTGDDPPPVLIGWADAVEVSDLGGRVAGIGGATMLELGRLRGYVTGVVVLDTQSTDRLAAVPGGDTVHRGLLMHELGHLVGLDHVDDPTELMYAEGVTRPEYGPGDRAGLARLGAIDC